MFFSLFAISSFAEEETIEISLQSWNQNERSALTLPVVSHDGNMLYIYSDETLKDIQVQVKDIFGCIVYFNIITVTEGQKQLFYMNNILRGNYQLELIYKNTVCSGCFFCDKRDTLID